MSMPRSLFLSASRPCWQSLLTITPSIRSFLDFGPSTTVQSSWMSMHGTNCFETFPSSDPLWPREHHQWPGTHCWHWSVQQLVPLKSSLVLRIHKRKEGLKWAVGGGGMHGAKSCSYVLDADVCKHVKTWESSSCLGSSLWSYPDALNRYAKLASSFPTRSGHHRTLSDSSPFASRMCSLGFVTIPYSARKPSELTSASEYNHSRWIPCPPFSCILRSSHLFSPCLCRPPKELVSHSEALPFFSLTRHLSLQDPWSYSRLPRGYSHTSLKPGSLRKRM